MSTQLLIANWESISLYWFIVWTLTATAVWAGAAGWAACLRRNSAHARHRVWMLSMFAVLIAPLVAPLLPLPRWWSWSHEGDADRIAIAVLPSRVNGGEIMVGAKPSAAAAPNSERLSTTHDRSIAAPAPVARLASTADAAASRPKINEKGPRPLTWRSILIAIWLGGAALSLLMFTIGLWRIRRLRRRAVILLDGVETTMCRELRQRLGIRRNVKLLVTPRATVPFLAGIFESAIVLPSGFGRWVPQRLRVVLTHELIHLQRNDVLWEIVAQLAMIPAWFHPLGWFATKRLRVERELACDDAVLIAGERPADYAEQLVEVAAELGSRSWRATPVVAIAGASPIERRVRSILDPRVWRAPLDRWRTVGLSLGMAGLVLAVAALSPSIGEEKGESPLAATEQTRVLHFPGDRTMGIVFWRKAPPKSGDKLSMYGEEWHKVADARGEVHLPADGEARLDVSKAASSDLTGLDQIQPDDLRGLKCVDTDVSDEGLRHIGRLTGLRMLDLGETPITDGSSQSFAGLKKLQWITLDAFDVNSKGFGVGDETLKVLARLPELEVIRLRDTKVTDAGIAELAQAKSLTDVEVPGTKVSDAGMKYLKQLPHLDTLRLGVLDEGTKITDIGLATIGEMTGLKYLDLSGTKITDKGLPHLQNLSHLESLTLDNTRITEAGLVHLEPLHALRDVRLYITPHGGRGIVPLTDIGAANLAKIKSLRRLTAFLEVTDKGVAMLATLPDLETIEINGKGVTDKSAELIGQMKSLKWLEFQDCPITDKALMSFSQLSNLELFRLYRTRVSGDGLQHLRKLPKLSLLGIYFDERRQHPPNLHPSLREVGRFRQIDNLDLGGDVLTNDDLKELAELQQLKELILDFPVTDEGVGHLTGLTNLTSLSIKQGRVTDAGLRQISKLRNLDYLWIVGDFTDSGVASLADLELLQSLQIGSAHMTEAGLRSLQQKLAALQFVQNIGPPASIEQQTAEEFERPASAIERNRDAKEFARLADANVLITFANPEAPLTKRLFKLHLDYGGDLSHSVNNDYRTIAIPTVGPKRDQAAVLAKELGVAVPKGEIPLIVAEAADGKVLGTLTGPDLVTKEDEIAEAALLAFVKQHGPPRLDGRKLFDDALAQAKRENKRLLIDETAVWCGPCHMLAAFLDKNRAVWEKDYLWIKMDPRWPHAAEIMRSLRGEASGGYPWFAILDADGKVLATSNKPDGDNIGFPSEPDSVDHFLKMLKSTALRMTDEDFARLKKAFESSNRGM